MPAPLRVAEQHSLPPTLATTQYCNAGVNRHRNELNKLQNFDQLINILIREKGITWGEPQPPMPSSENLLIPTRFPGESAPARIGRRIGTFHPANPLERGRTDRHVRECLASDESHPYGLPPDTPPPKPYQAEIAGGQEHVLDSGAAVLRTVIGPGCTGRIAAHQNGRRRLKHHLAVGVEGGYGIELCPVGDNQKMPGPLIATEGAIMAASMMA
jgi:hypothetical protein